MTKTNLGFPDDDDEDGWHKALGGSKDPHIEAPLEKLQRLRDLQAQVRELQEEADQDGYQQKRKELLHECPHPLSLAAKFDHGIVQTPAMALVSQRWVDTLRKRDGRLTISVPPQQGKSLTARWAIFWALLDDPTRRVVFASYGQALARTSGRIVRSLVEQFGEPYGLLLDESHRDAADWQLQKHGGGCLAAGVGSSLTGRPSDLMVLDDLLAGQSEANSELVKTNVSEWWDSVARTRMAPGTPAVAIGTRWAEDDILARFIEEGWTRLNIPATNVPGDETLDSLEETDAGRTENGYLVSTRGTTEEDWEVIRRESGSRTWEALFRGNPTPPEGGIFLKAWFNDHRITNPDDAPKMREIVIGVDPAETGLADEAGILVVGRGIDNHLYILSDLSGMLTQAQWARRACMAWIEHGAHRVIQERTLGSQTSIAQAWSVLRRQAVAIERFGSVQTASDELIARGDSAAASIRDLHDIEPLVESIIDAGGHGPRVVTLTPKQSKTVRAETATQPFETGRAHMVGPKGRFEKLEHEAVHWQPGMPSPNRLDVLSLVINHFGTRGGIIV